MVFNFWGYYYYPNLLKKEREKEKMFIIKLKKLFIYLTYFWSKIKMVVYGISYLLAFLSLHIALFYVWEHCFEIWKVEEILKIPENAQLIPRVENLEYNEEYNRIIMPHDIENIHRIPNFPGLPRDNFQVPDFNFRDWLHHLNDSMIQEDQGNFIYQDDLGVIYYDLNDEVLYNYHQYLLEVGFDITEELAQEIFQEQAHLLDPLNYGAYYFQQQTEPAESPEIITNALDAVNSSNARIHDVEIALQFNSNESSNNIVVGLIIIGVCLMHITMLGPFV